MTSTIVWSSSKGHPRFILGRAKDWCTYSGPPQLSTWVKFLRHEGRNLTWGRWGLLRGKRSFAKRTWIWLTCDSWRRWDLECHLFLTRIGIERCTVGCISWSSELLLWSLTWPLCWVLRNNPLFSCAMSIQAQEASQNRTLTTNIRGKFSELKRFKLNLFFEVQAPKVYKDHYVSLLQAKSIHKRPHEMRNARRAAFKSDNSKKGLVFERFSWIRERLVIWTSFWAKSSLCMSGRPDCTSAFESAFGLPELLMSWCITTDNIRNRRFSNSQKFKSGMRRYRTSKGS